MRWSDSMVEDLRGKVTHETFHHYIAVCNIIKDFKMKFLTTFLLLSSLILAEGTTLKHVGLMPFKGDGFTSVQLKTVLITGSCTLPRC